MKIGFKIDLDNEDNYDLLYYNQENRLMNDLELVRDHVVVQL